MAYTSVLSYPYETDIRYRDRHIRFTIADAVGKEWYLDVPDNHSIIREKCLYFIQSGSHVVDCGSHHGLMTVLFAEKAGANGKVTAFDALPSNAAIVRKNAEINGLTNIVANAKAIGDKSGTHKVLAETSNVILNDDRTHAPDGEVDVDVTSLDDAKLGHVDFLKIDVEGHEVAALVGAKKLLRQLPVLDIEIHNFLFSNYEEHVKNIVGALPVEEYLFSIDESSHWCEVDVLNLYYLASLPNPHLFAKPKPRTKLEKLVRRMF